MKLNLKYPVYPYRVNQNFGLSYACTEDNDKPLSQRKVVGKSGPDYDHLTCPVGYVELYPLMGIKGHTGQDLYATHGTPCYYSGPEGSVVEIQTEEARGLGVGIITKDKFDFEGGEYHAKTRYWHFMSFEVKLGDIVKTGDLIGYCDNTGFSAGSHLHLELKPVLYNSQGVYYNVFQDNGYYGSVDPVPYWTGEYAHEYAFQFTKDMFLGSKGTEVAELQKFLIKFGFMKDFPEAKGHFGLKTKKAVQSLQLLYNISPSFGYVGKKTRVALNALK